MRATLEKGSGLVIPPNQRVTSLSDQEALRLIHSYRLAGDASQDPIHLALSRQWFQNVCFFVGLQVPEMPKMPSDFALMNFDAETRKYVANHIFRIVLGQVARLSGTPIRWDVVPESPDIDDQEGARVGSWFLEHYQEKFKLRIKRRDLEFWRVVCGTAFMRADFNTHVGDVFTTYKDPTTGETIPAGVLSEAQRKFARELGSYEEEREGEIEVETLSPFQVLVPHQITEPEHQDWMCVTYNRSLGWLWDNYPDVAKVFVPDDLTTTEDGFYWRRLTGLVNRQGFTITPPTNDEQRCVQVYELWIAPSGQWPKGLKVVATKHHLLENGPHPYHAAGIDLRRFPSLKFPADRYRYCPAPGRYWGLSLVEHLLDGQMEYNRGRQQMQAMRDILAAPQWLAPDGAEIGILNNDYGVVWTYKGYQKPELQPPPPVSQMHVETEQQAIYDMQTISAQSDVSQAQVPTGVRSGVAIRALQEKDMQVMGPVVDEMEDMWASFGSRLLALTHKFVSTEKSIRMYGEFRQGDVGIFKGSDLNGNIFVRVVPGSMMPKSKAEVMQNVMDLMQLGALNPAVNPEHAEIVMQSMEIPGTEGLFFEMHLDKRRARMENQMFLRPSVNKATGATQPFPDVLDDDDHAVHYQEHMRFKKSDAYEKLPIMRKLAFDAHVAKHKMAIAALIQTQQVMSGAGAPQGSAPRPLGQPSPPSREEGAE